MKVSEVEAEFHRRILEVQEEFRNLISDLQAEFCRVNSATEGVAVPTISLPSNETNGQEWRLVSSGAKRGKVLRAPQQVETENSFAVLEGVEEEKEKAGGDEEKKVKSVLGIERLSVQLDTCLADGTKTIDFLSAGVEMTFAR
ncbi:hypothetical protein E2C01_061000 [Portunus trituberculatus]|uniref:Uncharacterized protein n=1 Tax=Portunus trituberculatus TaxID=210409 RepID=A0A5B7HB49_PORTR|nr:hypothetical protein [Portunus trituberculatus]